MKKLEELGISPAPWKVCEERSLGGDVVGVECADVKADLVAGDVILKEADANMMSAAPDMYEELREAINSYCEGCNDFVNGDQRCDPCECPARKWRAALAKAAGEEVADGTKH